jgi:hypothetical protein
MGAAESSNTSFRDLTDDENLEKFARTVALHRVWHGLVERGEDAVCFPFGKLCPQSVSRHC